MALNHSVYMFIRSVTRSVEYIKSIPMAWANLKFTVIRKQPVEVGRCFRSDEMAL